MLSKEYSVSIPCKQCGGRIFKVNISEDVIQSVERYPFTIVCMHVGLDAEKKQVHTMVAYIDKELNCRHVEVLQGKKVFVTPYILYNPNLLFLSCNKNIGNYHYQGEEEI